MIQPPGRKLRFGIVGIDDGLVTCHPPVERALDIARKALEADGHEVVTWDTSDHPDINKAVLAAFFDFGGSAIMEVLEPYSEPVFPSMEPYKTASSVGESDLGPTKLRMMNVKRNMMQKAYLDRWRATATDGKEMLDGIIMAVAPWCAPRLGQTQKSFYVGYTTVINLLGKQILRHVEFGPG